MMMHCSSGNQERHMPSRIYEHLRTRFAEYQSVSQSGEKNSQFGTSWVFHPLFGKKKVVKTKIVDYIEQGWFLGRHLKYVSTKKSAHRTTKLYKRQKGIDEYRRFLKIYSSVGFEEFVKITGYVYTKQNLVARFAKLLPEFVPQNGKKR